MIIYCLLECFGNLSQSWGLKRHFWEFSTGSEDTQKSHGCLTSLQHCSWCFVILCVFVPFSNKGIRHCLQYYSLGQNELQQKFPSFKDYEISLSAPSVEYRVALCDRSTCYFYCNDFVQDCSKYFMINSLCAQTNCRYPDNILLELSKKKKKKDVVYMFHFYTKYRSIFYLVNVSLTTGSLSYL